ncbi:portal protein, partial [Herbiconiux daphne]
MMTTYPQYQAARGQYDRQSLLNNRPGAVIEVQAIGAVERFQPMQLTDTYVAANNQLKEIAQETLTQPTDITNGDGGMSQVSTATAYLNIFNQAQRELMITESLSDTFFKPFFTHLYELIKDENIQLVDPDNNPIDGAKLPNVFEFAVDPSTTNDQFAQHMQVKDMVA